MNWKIGDAVIAKYTHSKNKFIKGQEYVIYGFHSCQGCGKPGIYLEGFGRIVDMECNNHVANGCGHIEKNTREFFSCIMFEKPFHISAGIEYYNQVTAPELKELTKLKELQNQ